METAIQKAQRIAAMFAAKRAALTPTNPTAPVQTLAEQLAPKTVTINLPANRQQIDLTEKQLEAIKLATSFRSFCLIGAAGTGKTTTVRQLCQSMIDSGRLHKFYEGTKHLSAGDYAIAFVAYTNRAVENMRKQLPREFQHNALTIHKLLEPMPVFTEDPETGKTHMDFVFQRNAMNPIRELQIVVVEESSMVDIELHHKLRIACPNAIFIYLGDLFQLKPVYGSAILGFKLLTLPVVELDKVWRQALDSHIIKLAHIVKDGITLTPAMMAEMNPNQVEFRPFKAKLSGDSAVLAFCRKIRIELHKEFDPLQDIMLCPNNKSFGSIEINKAFAQIYGELRGATVYEIIAGYKKHYFAEGDKVMFDKRDFIIEKIEWNKDYLGVTPQLPSKDLNRHGINTSGHADIDFDAVADEDEDGMELNLDFDDVESKVNQASHKLTLRPIYPLYEDEGNSVVKETGQINSMDFSYCISVHKAQGSEWQRVFLVLHNSHRNMLSRELLYTATTRARSKLIIFFDPDSAKMVYDSSINKAIKNVQIKGRTVMQKAEQFKGKLENLPANILSTVTESGDWEE